MQAADSDTVVVDRRTVKRRGKVVAIDVERVVHEAAQTISRVRTKLGTL